ncbi:MAG: hypothetical protein GF315_02450 [candidate division Zixibacteria bacterium]|nr:hypothetical protein [candidate division Zixibacteria bacterium]
MDKNIVIEKEKREAPQSRIVNPEPNDIRIKKCRYFNNYQTCATLMLDDLSLTALDDDGSIKPWSDWGFRLNSEGSMFRYLEDNLLKKYPEVKGTFFFPIGKHAAMHHNAGYRLHFNEMNESFKCFANEMSNRFEIAFHGTNHGRYKDNNNPSMSNWDQEFEYLTLDNIPALAREIERVEDFLGIKMHGGKYPGYRMNGDSKKIVESLGFKWWCSHDSMINRKHNDNRHYYFGEENRVLGFPTNLSGCVFNHHLKSGFAPGSFTQRLRREFRMIRFENYIRYLYKKGLIISIQEHHFCLRTDGKRQTPNAFDDINSLDMIFGFLRGADIWYATCSEIAHYLESYDHTDVEKQSNGNVILKYNGRWDEPLITLKSNCRQLQNVSTGEILPGVYRQGEWLYNGIKEGEYKTI